MRPFTITGTTQRASLGADGRGEMLFNVANAGNAPDRALARVVPLGNTRTEWMQIAGEAEREFQPNGTHQYSVALAVPAGTPPGPYTFRFDIASARKTGEEYVEGPTATFEVPVTAKPQSRWWIWAVAALAVLLIAGVAAWLLLRPSPEVSVATATSEPSPAPAPVPVPVPETVPDVASGRTFVVDGVAELQNAGFTVALFARLDAARRAGTIVDQSPEAGTQQQKGSRIELTVAVRRPVDLALDDADAEHLSAATARRLRDVFATTIDPAEPPPAANVSVPQLQGTALVEAMLALQSRDLRAVIRVADAPDVLVGVVRRQQPGAGASVSRGDAVGLTVGTRGALVVTREQFHALTPFHQQQLQRARTTQSAMRRAKENR
jgi:hypothetical protein